MVLVFNLLKTKKELKNLCEQEMQIMFIRILIKLVFNMMWPNVNIKLWLKEQNQRKFY